jgi:hypothetical protein
LLREPHAASRTVTRTQRKGRIVPLSRKPAERPTVSVADIGRFFMIGLVIAAVGYFAWLLALPFL